MQTGCLLFWVSQMPPRYRGRYICRYRNRCRLVACCFGCPRCFPDTDADADTDADPAPDPDPVPDPDPDLDAEPDTDPDTDPGTGTGTDADTETDTCAATDTDTDTDTDCLPHISTPVNAYRQLLGCFAGIFLFDFI